MARRRELFRLSEVELEPELAIIAEKGRRAVVLTDLQKGVLTAVVEYPTFRKGLTEVPSAVWKEVTTADFAVRSGRRGKDDEEFTLSAEEFIEGERKKLKATTLAVHRGIEAEMDVDYANYFRANGTLKAEMMPKDWEELLLNCFRWQRDLVENATVSLVPMVRASKLERYIDAVKPDYSVDELPTNGKGGGKRGRPPLGHWNAILSEAFRRLAVRKEPLDGDVQDFAKELRAWAVAKWGETVPKDNTVAGRIRQVLDGGLFVFD